MVENGNASRYRTLILGDCELAYIQRGAGPDIVWIPGGDQTAEAYDDQFAAFEVDYRCTSFDPRGVGGTISRSSTPWSIATFAADCAALIRQVCEPPVVVTGLSMGALIVQELALSHPKLVRIAIPMGTGARKTGFYREWEEAEIRLAETGTTLPPDFSIAHYAALTYPADVLGDDALWAGCRPFIADAYDNRDPGMLAAQWRACLDYDSHDRLPDCRVPMHVIAFSEDLQTPPARGRLVAERAGNGHFHLLKGLGHYSMFGHRPEVVNDCIRTIIEGYD